MADLTHKEIVRLRTDAKTLSDVADMLERDGRFTVLPSILADISGNLSALARRSMAKARKETSEDERPTAGRSADLCRKAEGYPVDAGVR